jgi:hypothetical protein
MLQALGFRNVSELSAAQYNDFQLEYVERKISLESVPDFVTERSFLDAYVYWEDRCAGLASAKSAQEILDRCRERARSYDLHVFLPFGVIPFVPDGHRHPSPEFHQRISDRISTLLVDWSLTHIRCNVGDLNARLAQCRSALRDLGLA